MKELKLDIQSKVYDFDTIIDIESLNNVIFVEDSKELHCASQIILSGKYNRIYTVVSYINELNEYRVELDGDLLLFCLWSTIAVIDLKQDKLLKSVKLNSWELLELYKFKSGYIIHGEDAIRFMNDNFEIVWDVGAVDIYANCLVEKAFEVFDDYVIAFDWYGDKHYFDENGEFKIEHYPEYNSEN